MERRKQWSNAEKLLMVFLAVCILGAVLTWIHGGKNVSEYQEGESVWKADHVALADKEVKSKVDEVISQIITEDMSEYEKVKAVHDYMVLHCAYDEEHYETDTIPEESFSPRGVLLKGSAVCEGYAAAFKAFMDELQIPCQLITGTASSSGDFSGPVNHAWNIVQIDGIWYQIDTTWDDPVPDRKGEVQYDFFLISDKKMKQTHQWDAKKYPECLCDYYRIGYTDNNWCYL